MDQAVFILNRTYQRSRIHDLYGGNRQSGISVSAKEPFIFIFSGQAGHQHGYKDQWENENVFSYTGEGQLNNMRFIKGNLALRDHLRNNRRVFLFIHAKKSFVTFEGELELIDLDFFEGPDREGQDRTAIKFFFKKIHALIDYPVTQVSLSLIENAKQYIKLNIPNETEKRGLVTSRVGQGAYRKSVLYRWDFKCAVTNYSKNEILIASYPHG